MTNKRQRRCALPRLETLEERTLLAAEFYSIEGIGNNLANPEWGSTNIPLLRLTQVQYADGISTPAGEDRPSARAVSNAVVAQSGSIPDDRYLTDMVWLWGQFVDHDIDLTKNGTVVEPLPIPVPTGDPFFDPFGTGAATIGFNRSIFDPSTGTSTANPREQLNQITAYLDGSVVYGSDPALAARLRTFEGGRMRTSEGDLLPFVDETGESKLFLGGDGRANENVALVAMHTLWVREHNRLADGYAQADPSLDDEALYQKARARVTAELQAITYNEFLPALLGQDALSPYRGYDPDVNVGIANVFSTAAYRFGHSQLNSEILRLDNDGNVIDAGNLSLADAFFAPQEVIDYGIDPLLKGVTEQRAQQVDSKLVDEVRNFLFGPPGAGGFDLASLNIQRGRDHGLASYNQTRIDYGLAPVTDFDQITSDPELQQQLRSVYGDVDSIDVWVGGLAEDRLPGSAVGELFQTIMVDQFERVRDGDRFWFENIYSGRELREIRNTTLKDVIERNTGISGLRENLFFDSSVLFVKAGGRGLNVTVTDRNGEIQVIDNRTNRILQSRDADEVSQVYLVGADYRRDNVVVRLSSDVSLEGGLAVHGGAGVWDTLTVIGTRQADDFTVTADSVDLNGTTIAYTGIDTLRLDGRAGNDTFTVSADTAVPTQIFGGRGNDTLRGNDDNVLFLGGPGRDRVFDLDGNEERWSWWSELIGYRRAAVDWFFAHRDSNWIW